MCVVRYVRIVVLLVYDCCCGVVCGCFVVFDVCSPYGCLVFMLACIIYIYIET